MSNNPWILGARPKTLPAVLSPIILGIAIGYHENKVFNLINAILVLIIGLALQIAVNYANDYSDGIKGSDTNRVGPIRLVGSGLASPQAVKRAAFIAIGIASIFGLYFASRTSWLLLLVGVLAIFATWGYTGGKNPYGYRGLGEVSVFIFFGLVATIGSSYGQSKNISWLPIIFSIAMGTFSCGILMANNIRDLPMDREVGKKTLAVRIGDSNSRKLVILFLITPYLILILASIKTPWLLIALITLIPTFKLIKIIRRQAVGKELIPVLAGVGKIQLGYAIICAATYFIVK
jgi:1,4-dihydroxy-2-naphthoate octaprenyltransferase